MNHEVNKSSQSPKIRRKKLGVLLLPFRNEFRKSKQTKQKIPNQTKN